MEKSKLEIQKKVDLLLRSSEEKSFWLWTGVFSFVIW